MNRTKQMTTKGYKQTFETRKRMSAAQRKRFSTPEGRAKLSAACKGRIISPETKAKMKIAQRKLHDLPEYRAKLSKAMKGRIMSPEWIARISKALKGKKFSPEHKAKISVNMSRIHKDRRKTLEHRTNISIGHNKLYETPEYQASVTAGLRRAWREKSQEERDKHIQAIMLGMQAHPNKPELYLLELLDAIYPNEWKYVGNGQFILGGKNPDFVNVDGRKQIIELFGNYWHSKERTGRTEKEEVRHRQKVYSQYGYGTLVIWQSELKNQSKVLTKISKFVSNNNFVVGKI